MRGQVRNDTFRVILLAATLTGVPFGKSCLSSKQTVLIRIIQVWSVSVFCLRTVCIMILCAFSLYLFPSVARRYSFVIHCLTGYASLLFFTVNRRKIVTSVIKKLPTNSDLSREAATADKPPIKARLLLFCLCLAYVSYFALGMEFFFYKAWFGYSRRLEPLIVFAHDAEISYYFTWVVVFSTSISYCSSIATLYVILFLSAKAYSDSSEVFAKYAQELKKDIRNRYPLDTVLSRYISLFKVIVGDFRELDKTLDLFAFIIYAYVVNNVFHTLGIFLSSDRSVRNIEADILVLVSAVSASVMLFYLTLSGDAIPRMTNVLKDYLITLSYRVVEQSPDVPTIMMFDMLCDTIRSTQVFATIFGMFNITRNFLTSVTGAIVTYGILTYQLGVVEGS